MVKQANSLLLSQFFGSILFYQAFMTLFIFSSGNLFCFLNPSLFSRYYDCSSLLKKRSSGNSLEWPSCNRLYVSSVVHKKTPQIKRNNINGEAFVEQIMKPHTLHYKSLKSLLSISSIHDMAHITSGDVEKIIGRIIPNESCAEICWN